MWDRRPPDARTLGESFFAPAPKPAKLKAKKQALNEPKGLRHFHLFDLGDLQVQRLKRLRKEVGEGRDIHIYPGDFNTDVADVLQPSVISKKEATFALLDQRCFECKWSTVERLADYKRPRIELMYFLAEGWLDRSLASATRDPKLEQIEAWWGRSDVEKVKGATGEGEVLNHLAGTAVPVPGVLASESDPRFFGAPFLLLESIDAAHVPARADRFPGGRRSQRWGRSAPDTRSSSSTTRP